MKHSLRMKLSFSYILITLVCISLISFLTNAFLEKQFREYVIKKQEQTNKEISSMISHQYGSNGKWDTAVIENIGVNALEQGLIIKVKNKSGETIWDAMVHNNGLCTMMITHMAQNMTSRYPNWEGGYIENKYSIIHDFQEVGIVEIGYFGPFYFNDNDLAFINSLNNLLIGVGIFSLILSLFLATIMAKRISMPILKVINATQMISRGYFGERITEDSNTKEIGQLTEAVNGLAEALEKQEILRKRLTGDVAHELRTPLATLQSHMEAMIDGIWEPDVKRLKSCHEEILRINRMVGDMENLARFEGENLILNRMSFDIFEHTEKIIKNFESEFKNRNIEIKLMGKKQIIHGDKDKVSQIIVNLISNALKYTAEGGKVHVAVDGSDSSVELIVRDSGIGISDKDLPYIFERFYRADKSRNRLTGGSGIGLTITKALVEAHKGRITVKSKLGEGTEFFVSLPKKAD